MIRNQKLEEVWLSMMNNRQNKILKESSPHWDGSKTPTRQSNYRLDDNYDPYDEDDNNYDPYDEDDNNYDPYDEDDDLKYVDLNNLYDEYALDDIVEDVLRTMKGIYGHTNFISRQDLYDNTLKSLKRRSPEFTFEDFKNFARREASRRIKELNIAAKLKRKLKESFRDEYEPEDYNELDEFVPEDEDDDDEYADVDQNNSDEDEDRNVDMTNPQHVEELKAMVRNKISTFDFPYGKRISPEYAYKKTLYELKKWKPIFKFYEFEEFLTDSIYERVYGSYRSRFRRRIENM